MTDRRSIPPATRISGFTAFLASLAIETIYLVARFASLLPGHAGKAISRQIQGRTSGPDSARQIPRCPDEAAGDLLFFCSSAGEFEQARPVMDLARVKLGLDPMVIFLSRSGMDFVKSRGERVRAALAPPDSIWRWRAFDSRHRIRAAVVIRHEWWPGFLHMFSRRRPVLLIDAVRPAGSPDSWLRNRGRAFLARYFSRICAVDEESAAFFAENLGIDPSRLRATGDTKYDRAMERAAHTRIQDGLRREVADFARGRKILVCGSAYEADVDLISSAWVSNPGLDPGWAVVIIPHHTDPDTAARLSARMETSGCKFLILSRLGILAELYSLADAAWVGGACHHRIHNVLEPASHGVDLACGMKFTNSMEAVHMHRAGILHAVASPAEFALWLATCSVKDPAQKRDSHAIAFVRTRSGATTAICDEIARGLQETKGI